MKKKMKAAGNGKPKKEERDIDYWFFLREYNEK
jgi:hypothetical protein